MPTPSWEHCQPSGADNIPPPPNQPQAKERNPKLPQAIEQIPVSTPLRLCLFPLRACKRRAREAILSGFGLQIALENLKAPWSTISSGTKVNCFNFRIHTLANFFSSATLFHLLIALLGVNVAFNAGCMEMQISVGNGYISQSFLKRCTFQWPSWYCIYSPNCNSHPQGVDLYNCEEFCITSPSLPIHYDMFSLSKEWSLTRLHLRYFSLFLGWSMCPHLECWCKVTWQP